MPFDAFDPDLITFLTELRQHNTRKWFGKQKDRYEAVFKAPAEAFADALAPELARLSPAPVTSKVFRIYRDVRFSKDKSPYHSYLRLSFAPAQGAPWFIGIDPDGLALGTGYFELKGPALADYRAKIAGVGGEAVETLLKTTHLRLSKPALKRVPPQFDADHPRAHLLRHKGFTVWRDFDVDFATAPDLVSRVKTEFEALKPIRDWLG